VLPLNADIMLSNDYNIYLRQFCSLLQPNFLKIANSALTTFWLPFGIQSIAKKETAFLSPHHDARRC
jgi:hypothetical protein